MATVKRARRKTPIPKRAGKRAPARLAPNGPALVVGMGASAGGLEAFQRFFRAMPADSGMAFVLVMHLDPRHESAMAEVLGRSTAMRVAFVTAPTRIAPDHVYVIAPGTALTIKDKRLVPEAGTAVRAPIDAFFLSLAQAYGDRGVCVVLSGTGSDGTLGLKAVKAAGGLTIAQTSESAQYTGMPRSAEATGSVDLMLAAEKIPAKLVVHARHWPRFNHGADAEGLQQQARDHLASIFTLLRAKTGHDFSAYKQSTVLRRIQRRMQVLQLDQVPSFVERLRKEPEEINRLFEDLLIGVTHFFRDRPAFEALETQIIPKLFENRVDDQIRVWIAGCATGEEAYSVAILLREYMQKAEVAPKIQIFATDIDERALEVARTGVYPAVIARDLEPRRLQQYFMPRGDGLQITKDIREMVVFSLHDLIKDPPFSRLDLVTCRNVLIYMNAELQNRLLPVFHFALRPGRYLFLGPSENVTQQSKYFAAVDTKRRIFRTSATVAPQIPALGPPAEHGRSPAERPAAAKPTGHKALLAAIDRTLIGSFMPAYVVTSDRFELIYASSGVGKYLEVPAGAPNTNVINMARKGLRIELRAALAAALENKRRIVHEDVVVAINGGSQPIRLVVQPFAVSDEEDSFLLVAFHDVAPTPSREGGRPERRANTEGAIVEELENELRATQTRLQTTIEELETSNEELKSSNEEFQSMNEELQSANEELETSREELQSVNEELETVNNELNSKVESLDRANSDLKNLLESTQIATIFLDRRNRIRSFTPPMKHVFHVIESDIGRPVTDIAWRIAAPSLLAEIDAVLETLQPVEREVQLADGSATYLMRILPYRTIDHVIDGVVINFIAITERKALEEERGRLGNLVAFSNDAIVSVTLDEKIATWNAAAERAFGLASPDAIGQRWTALFPPENAAEARRWFERAKRDEPARQLDTMMVARDGQTVPVSLSLSAVRDLGGRLTGVSLIARDITERKHAEQQQQLLLAELNHRVKNTLAAVLSIANQTIDDAPSLKEFQGSFAGRIRALSATQSLLTKSNWAGAALRDIVAAESAPYRKRGDGNMQISGPDVVLTPRAALSFALLMHELSTNAVRHGALSRPDGRVSVAWEIAGDGTDARLVVQWTEMGGPKVTQPHHRGFGLRLIEEGVAYELTGCAALEFNAAGLRCRIEVPARAAIAGPAAVPSG